MKRVIPLLLLLPSLLSFAESSHTATPISTTQSESRDIDLVLKSVGFLRSKASPSLSSEIEGSIIAIHTFEGQAVQKGQLLAELNAEDFTQIVVIKKAEIERLNALIKNQKRTVKRYQKLLQQRSVSQDKLDESESLLMALNAQLSGAKAGLSLANINLKRTKIIAPVSGQVERRLVSVGDYLKKGTPLFKLSRTDILEAHLPFPEQLSNYFEIGQVTELRTATAGKPITGTISALHPEIERQSLSMEVIVEINNPGGWKPGASVEGEVTVERHKNATLIPSRSIVRRPSGKVVYLIREGLAIEQKVTTGIQQTGKTEVLSGLSAGQIIALDGAHWLSNGLPVRIKMATAQ
jgi:RND family efflux transporter MFP subunit